MPPGLRRILFVALAVVLAAGCSGGAKQHTGTETSSTAFTKPTVALEVGSADLVSPHKAFGPLERSTTDAAVKVVERLLLITSAQPLAAGKAGPGFAALFTPDAGARAAGVDRAAFFDEGLPSFGELKPNVARVRLTGLAGSMDPATALVVARFAWDVGSTDHPGDRIVRSGELSLILDGGHWRIGAYTLTVKRTIDDTTTTTTATTATTR